MEGGSSPDALRVSIIAGGFVAAVLLLIYAIRRARRARQRQIDEAGEERPIASAKPKKAALRAEDVDPEAPSPTTPDVPTDVLTEEDATPSSPPALVREADEIATRRSPEAAPSEKDAAPPSAAPPESPARARRPRSTPTTKAVVECVPASGRTSRREQGACSSGA